MLKIKLFGETGNYQSAESALKKLIELNPQEPGFRRLLVNFYIEQQRFDDAESELRNFAGRSSFGCRAGVRASSISLYDQKIFAGCTAGIEHTHQVGWATFSRIKMALADLHVTEGRLADGKQLLEQMIAPGNFPEHIREAKVALAQLYLNQKDFDAAGTLIDGVLRDDAHNVAALKLRASLNLDRAQLDAAIADLNDALTSKPRSTDLLLLLAKAYERSGLIELADKALADATKISNLDAKIALEYVDFLQRRGSTARAEDILLRLEKRWPNDTTILSTLGMAKLARQDWSGALQEVASLSIRRINGGAKWHRRSDPRRCVDWPKQVRRSDGGVSKTLIAQLPPLHSRSNLSFGRC